MGIDTTAWKTRYEQFLAGEGLRRMTVDEVRAAVPQEILEQEIEAPEDPEALFGVGPLPFADVRRNSDKQAPYYDTELMATYDVEVASVAHCAAVVATMPHGACVVDAGLPKCASGPI